MEKKDNIFNTTFKVEKTLNYNTGILTIKIYGYSFGKKTLVFESTKYDVHKFTTHTDGLDGAINRIYQFISNLDTLPKKE